MGRVIPSLPRGAFGESQIEATFVPNRIGTGYSLSPSTPQEHGKSADFCGQEETAGDADDAERAREFLGCSQRLPR